jgi:hypothetical protein
MANIGHFSFLDESALKGPKFQAKGAGNRDIHDDLIAVFHRF